MLSRSLLFVPGNKEKMLAKINEQLADIILIDLEDAVILEDKETSRELINEYIQTYKKDVFIRVNNVNSDDFIKDMHFINKISNAECLKGVMLPQVNSKEDINILKKHLNNFESKLDKKEKNKFSIIPLIEDAYGVYNIDEIIQSSDRIFKIAFGGEDFSYDINAKRTENETELLFARSKIVLASRAHDIESPIDTVYTDINNSKGFKENCFFVKSLGFEGKLLIHPSQVEHANIIFAPSLKEVDFAKKVVLESKNNNGTFQLEGEMIDKPIIDKAQKLINKHIEITKVKEDEKND